jgi:hypothetical protein
MRINYISANDTLVRIPVEDIRILVGAAIFDAAAEAAALAILNEDVIELTP